MKPLIAIALFTVMIACNETEQKNTEVQDTPPAANTDLPTGKKCYQYASAGDTIWMELNRKGNDVSGTLVYKLKEKDRNSGTIKGEMKDRILLADYSFQSEGMQSTRQVAFKLEGNYLVEGYGDMVDEGGKLSFNDPNNLSFTSKLKLEETQCQ